MGSIWGNQIKISLFGESHGAAIGVVMDGLPSGIPIHLDFIEQEMARRSAVGKNLVTGRREKDRVEILSGLYRGKTTGTPLTGIIRNLEFNSAEYDDIEHKPRPGHGDLTAHFRYQGFQDPRGGGHGSGRLTAPLMFAGAVSKLALKVIAPQMTFQSRMLQIGRATDPADFSREISLASQRGDSVGGWVEGVVTGVPAGIGDPFFDTVEGRLSGLLYAIPGVKGVAFGDGFDMVRAYGSEMNDPIVQSPEGIWTTTNHNGGINGGITNGMPIVVQVAFKPTPSIAIPQKTVDIETGNPVEISIKGRHDPCIAVRGCPVVEATLAIGVLDMVYK